MYMHSYTIHDSSYSGTEEDMKALVQDFLNGIYHPFSASVPPSPSLQHEQAPSSSEDGQTHTPRGKSGQAIISLRESGQTPHRMSSTNLCKPPPKKKRKTNGEFTHIHMYCTCTPMCTCTNDSHTCLGKWCRSC